LAGKSKITVVELRNDAYFVNLSSYSLPRKMTR